MGLEEIKGVKSCFECNGREFLCSEYHRMVCTDLCLYRQWADNDLWNNAKDNLLKLHFPDMMKRYLERDDVKNDD